MGFDDGASDTEEAVAAASNGTAHVGNERVIVAVMDSGINPYHEEFRAREGASLDLVPGAQPVDLSLEADNLTAAHEQDWETLMSLEEGVLYGFPGTKIVGAISFVDVYGEDWPRIVDDPESYGHGTMTSSRAVGNTVSIPGDDPGVGLVLVQTGTTTEAYEWVAEQDWIDVVSTSQCYCTGRPAEDQVRFPDHVAAVEELAQRKPTFHAAGNGLLGSDVGSPTWLEGGQYGVPDLISVGATDNDRHTTWSNRDPYVAADGCANPAATHGSMSEIRNRGGGTSAAAPFSAGAGAELILEAREVLDHTETGLELQEERQRPEDAWDSQAPHDHQLVLAEGDPGEITEGPLVDGTFTLRDFKDTLYHTALETPTTTDSDGERCGNSAIPGDAPSGAAFPLQGYGEVNEEAVALAKDVLHGEASMPERPAADVHYQRAHQLKEVLVSGLASGDGDIGASANLGD